MGRFRSTVRITHIDNFYSFTGNIYALNNNTSLNSNPSGVLDVTGRTYTPTGIIDVNIINKQPDICTCVSSVDPLDALKALREFLSELYTTITRITANTNVNAPLSTFISISGAMKYSLHTRILWTKFNPGVQFNPDNIIHINVLKDIYLSDNRDWHSDTFIVIQSRKIELNRA